MINKAYYAATLKGEIGNFNFQYSDELPILEKTDGRKLFTKVAHSCKAHVRNADKGESWSRFAACMWQRRVFPPCAWHEIVLCAEPGENNEAAAFLITLAF